MTPKRQSRSPIADYCASLAKSSAALKQAKRQVKQLPHAQRKKAEYRITKIEGLLPLAKQVVRQTRARVMRGAEGRRTIACAVGRAPH